MEETIDHALAVDDDNLDRPEDINKNDVGDNDDQDEMNVVENTANSCDSSEDQCGVNDEQDNATKAKRPPRSERKRQRHQELLVERRENRKKKKMERKDRMNNEKLDPHDDTARLSKRDVKVQTRQRLQDAMVTGQKICIDCSLEDWMSEKEKGKLAMQIGRLYGANKKADCPAHIYLTGLDLEKSLYRECVKKNDGFQHYLMDIKTESHTELFPLEKIVYLSPDSDNLLTDIDPDKVYIIGGLVDESVTKNITETKAREAGIRTARLPIHEYMDRLHQNTYSKVLALNQVFDIIVAYKSTHDWSQALAAGVPRRKGFVLKDLSKT